MVKEKKKEVKCMKKRILSWILVLCMVLGMIPVDAFADEVTNQPPTLIGEDSSRQ